jgi:hypothetical protein
LTLLSFENITAALKFPHKLKETLDRFAKVWKSKNDPISKLIARVPIYGNEAQL